MGIKRGNIYCRIAGFEKCAILVLTGAVGRAVVGRAVYSSSSPPPPPPPPYSSSSS